MRVLAIVAVLLYGFALLAGTAWLVVDHGWSCWWFVLALMLGDGAGKFTKKVLRVSGDATK